MLTRFVLLAGLTAFSLPALAQSAGLTPAKRDAMERACGGDVVTLCANTPQDDTLMSQCLSKNRDKLSPECRTAMAAMRREREQRKRH